ncbi:hypothetical protein DFH06DRAFT_1331089 [Mycena polygramma]|nr:hypothetical protein DFH06DRAFT_1331089 [Mycena polygramma]
MGRLCLPRSRHLPRLAALTLLALVFLSSYTILGTHTASRLVVYTPPPHAVQLGHPTFEEVREYERTLPQHRAASVFEKSRPRYLFFPWEAWGTGWNNVFQEQLLNTHLAYLTNRGYVFVDYIARDHPPFPDALSNGTRHMLHIPMTAFTTGPTGGGAWGPHSSPAVPRGVSQRWWELACPPERVVEVQLSATMRELNITDATSGAERLLRWAEKLREMPQECVAVVGGTPFDFVFMNLPEKVLSLWPSYGSSPTLTEFAWSPLITRALFRNRALFLSPSPSPSSSSNSPSSYSSDDDDKANTPPIPPALTPLRSPSLIINTYPLSAFAPLRIDAPPFPRLLALHIRRGDFEVHCKLLAERGMGFNAWAGLAALPDYLPKGEDAAIGHCWPDVDDVVGRVRRVRDEYLASSAASSSPSSPPSESSSAHESSSHDSHSQYLTEAEAQEPSRTRRLDTIYIATNADRAWVDALAGRLRGEGWRVGSSLEMWTSEVTSENKEFTRAEREEREERAVGQAVDMGVLVGAEVFIGQGFSSLTSNVVQLRLAGGRAPGTIRFW